MDDIDICVRSADSKTDSVKFLYPKMLDNIPHTIVTTMASCMSKTDFTRPEDPSRRK